jgi:EAL domain-containing protein (putative c-di-GMP-specific phosphodiesterase class I)
VSGLRGEYAGVLPGSRTRAPRASGADPRDRVLELARILDARAVTTVFQPIVELDAGRAVAYEALARGPENSALSAPDQLFAAAAAAGRTDELDWLCRATAVATALEAGLGRSASLFLNCEPSAAGVPCPPEYAAIWSEAKRELDLVLEVTERALTDRPAELSRVLEEHRAAGRGIALDDLGADVRSLALLPLIAPDVIKLDLSLVQDHGTAGRAAIVAAVSAERERTGAAVVAEGIENEAHLSVARTVGATLGQGWRWGRPGPLPASGSGDVRLPRVTEPVRPGGTPFEVVAPERPVAPSTKALLLPMSHHLENRALQIGEGAVILSAFQHGRHFTPATKQRYRQLAAGASLVAALGVGLRDEPASRVCGAELEPDDPLAGEWSVVVLGPHFAGALVAQDLGDTGPESERRFRFATTYDRGLVVAAARTLLERVAPAPAPPPAGLD